MGRKALAALLPVGCAFILLGVLNHVTLHLNVNHFGIIMGVLALICIAAGAWGALGELGILPASKPGAAVSVASVAAPVKMGEAPTPAPVAAGPDDPTIQS